MAPQQHTPLTAGEAIARGADQALYLIHYEATYSQAGIKLLAQRAARNKTRTARQGPVEVRITHMTPAAKPGAAV